MVPWMSWSPRAIASPTSCAPRKSETLIVQNVLDRQDRARVSDCSRSTSPSRRTSRPTDGMRALRGAARRHRRHLHGRSRDAARSPTSPTTTSPTTRRSTRPTASSSSTSRASAATQKLFRLDLAARQEDAAHLRHARRGGGAVPRRPTPSFSRRRRPIPRRRSTPEVARNGNIFNIWTLEPEERRAEAVHRRARRQRCRRSCCTKDGRQPRSRSSPTTRASYGIHTLRSQGAAAHGGVVRLRRARAHHRLPGAAPAHARRREQVEERDASRRCSSRAGRR